MSQSFQPSILVTHPWMGKGGSEAAAMWILQALQDEFRVTLSTAADIDMDDLNATYGSAVSKDRVSILRAPRLPGLRNGNRAVRLQHSLFEIHCRKLAPEFDLCISAYNPLDFGRPGIQMIGDLSFSEQMRTLYYPVENFYHRQSLLRRIYLAAGDALRRRERPALAERGDLAVANSQWVAGLLRQHFGIDRAPVTYPPVRLPESETTGGDQERNPLGFVWLGRISPEKKVDDLIDILSRVRAAGFPVTLQIAGTFSGTAYSRRIEAICAEHRRWITTPGFLGAAGKRMLLSSQSFSLHCNAAEPFGIAVAEMAAAGCLPFVPASGGAREIATAEALQFEDPDQAVEKIVALLENPDRAAILRSETAESVHRFSESEFTQSFLGHVKACLQDSTFTRPTQLLHYSGGAPQCRPSVLITHPWMAHGGSESVAMWTLQALQDRARITFLSASPVDLDRLNKTYGTSVRKDRIDIRQAPRLPGVRSEYQLVHLQRSLFERHCRRLAPRFDLCISTYNPVDFGRPAIQIIGDFSFSESLRKRLYPTRKSIHQKSILRKLYLGMSRFLRRPNVPLVQPTDLILANSRWSARILKGAFGIPHAPVIYPPVFLPDAIEAPANTSDHDPLGFVSIGRISPEKEIENTIEILERVRAAGHPVSLTLLGKFDDSDYSNRIAAMGAERGDWIRTPGFLGAARKQAVLAGCSFAIHSCRIESFGISVVEMAVAGCLPVVPDEGGASEIVGHSSLQFRDPDDAARKIITLLEEPSHAEKLRRELKSSALRFNSDAFMRQLQDEVDRFIDKPALPKKSRHDRKAVSAAV